MATLKLYEAAEGLAQVNAWIEEHADEILANGGALTPELESLLAQAEGDFRTKVERVALVIRQKKATAAAIKTEEDRLAQRRKVEENAAKSLTEYEKRCLEAAGEKSVKGTLVTVRLQANPPALRHGYAPEQLLAIADTEDAAPYDGQPDSLDPAEPPHPLAHFITVQRVAVLDGAALKEAYLAREQDLLETAAMLTLTPEERAAVRLNIEIAAADVPDMHAPPTDDEVEEAMAEAETDALAKKRAKYVADALAADFPGVSVERGTHVRIA